MVEVGVGQPDPSQLGGIDDRSQGLLSILITGTLSQAMANEPDLGWGKGRFTAVFPRLMHLLVAAHPPPNTGSTEPV